MRQGLIAIALVVVGGAFGWMKAGSPEDQAPAAQAVPGQPGDKPRPLKDNVVAVRSDDLALIEAKEEARKTLPRFRELIAANAPGTYTVKFPLKQNGDIEHIWMQVTGSTQSEFSGLIANPPVNGSRYEMGDAVTVKERDVEDWMVRTDKEIFGGYTTRVALKDLPEEEAAKYEGMFRD